MPQINSFIQRYIFHLRAGTISGSRVIRVERTRKFLLWLLRYQLQKRIHNMGKQAQFNFVFPTLEGTIRGD